MNAISCGLSVVLFLLFYLPPNFSQLTLNTSWRSEIKKFDYGGFVFYCGGLVLVLLGLCEFFCIASTLCCDILISLLASQLGEGPPIHGTLLTLFQP